MMSDLFLTNASDAKAFHVRDVAASSKLPKLKRKAIVSFARVKRVKAESLDEGDVDWSAVPAHVQQSSPSRYSTLQHMTETPMATTVLEALKKKGTDLKFMCSSVCGAAVQEGSKYFQTRALAKITKEARFHRRLAKDLPCVEKLKLPIQVKKKIKYRHFSILPACMVCGLKILKEPSIPGNFSWSHLIGSSEVLCARAPGSGGLSSVQLSCPTWCMARARRCNASCPWDCMLCFLANVLLHAVCLQTHGFLCDM